MIWKAVLAQNQFLFCGVMKAMMPYAGLLMKARRWRGMKPLPNSAEATPLYVCVMLMIGGPVKQNKPVLVLWEAEENPNYCRVGYRGKRVLKWDDAIERFGQTHTLIKRIQIKNWKGFEDERFNR